MPTEQKVPSPNLVPVQGPIYMEKSLEQKIAEKAAMKTSWDTDKKTWETVSIPRENSLGESHAPIILNGKHVFNAGETYLVPPDVASYVNDRLRVYAKACVRILQPRRDTESEAQVDRFGQASAQSSGSRVIPE